MKYNERLVKAMEKKIDEMSDLLMGMATNTEGGIQKAITYGFLASELENWFERVKRVEDE